MKLARDPQREGVDGGGTLAASRFHTAAEPARGAG